MLRKILPAVIQTLFLLAWCHLAVAQSNIIGGGVFGDAKKVTATGFSLAWVPGSNFTEASGGGTITYTAVPLGTASSNRIIAVFACNRAPAGSTTISSMTVDGISAVQAVGAQASGTELLSSDIWYANLGAASDNNTSGNIVVTWVGNTVRTGIEVYRITTSTPAPTAATENLGTGSASISQSITVPTGGAAISGSCARQTTATTYTNATLDNSSAFSGANSQFASANTTTVGSVSITATTAGNASDAAMSNAAWKP